MAVIIDDGLIFSDLMEKPSSGGRMEQKVFVEVGHGETISTQNPLGTKRENTTYANSLNFLNDQIPNQSRAAVQIFSLSKSVYDCFPSNAQTVPGQAASLGRRPTM